MEFSNVSHQKLLIIIARSSRPLGKCVCILAYVLPPEKRLWNPGQACLHSRLLSLILRRKGTLAGGLGPAPKEVSNSLPAQTQLPPQQKDAQEGLEAVLRRKALEAARAKPNPTPKQALNGPQPGAVARLNGFTSDAQESFIDEGKRRYQDKAKRSSQDRQESEAVQSRGNALRPEGAARTNSQQTSASKWKRKQDSEQVQARLAETAAAAAQPANAEDSPAYATGNIDTEQQRGSNGAASLEPEPEVDHIGSPKAPGASSVSDLFKYCFHVCSMNVAARKSCPCATCWFAS